jgi:hypothetical protein
MTQTLNATLSKFDLTLKGWHEFEYYPGLTPNYPNTHNDHNVLVKWVAAPNEEAVMLFVERHGLQDSLESVHFTGHSGTFQELGEFTDGVDLLIDAEGNVLGGVKQRGHKEEHLDGWKKEMRKVNKVLSGFRRQCLIVRALYAAKLWPKNQIRTGGSMPDLAKSRKVQSEQHRRNLLADIDGANELCKDNPILVDFRLLIAEAKVGDEWISEKKNSAFGKAMQSNCDLRVR